MIKVTAPTQVNIVHTPRLAIYNIVAGDTVYYGRCDYQDETHIVLKRVGNPEWFMLPLEVSQVLIKMWDDLGISLTSLEQLI